MNHLSVDAGLRVIFDAMDTPGGAEDADDDEVVSLQVSLADLRCKHCTLRVERCINFYMVSET